MTPQELNHWLQNDDMCLVVETNTERHLTVLNNKLHDLIDPEFIIELEKFTISSLSPISVLLFNNEDGSQMELKRL